MYNRSHFELSNDKRIIVVHCERYITNDMYTGRFISRKTLHNVCKKNCHLYEKCKNNIENAEDIGCLDAWKMTVGKGKKAY